MASSASQGCRFIICALGGILVLAGASVICNTGTHWGINVLNQFYAVLGLCLSPGSAWANTTRAMYIDSMTDSPDVTFNTVRHVPFETVLHQTQSPITTLAPFLVLTRQRSGSTSFMTAIGGVRLAGCRVSAERELSKGGCGRSAPQLMSKTEAKFRTVLKGPADNPEKSNTLCYGFKLIWLEKECGVWSRESLVRSYHEMLLAKYPRIKFVILRRRDDFSRYISLVRACMFGQWGGRNQANYTEHAAVASKAASSIRQGKAAPMRCKGKFLKLLTYEQFLENIFVMDHLYGVLSKGRPTLHVTSEDYFANGTSVLWRVRDFLCN